MKMQVWASVNEADVGNIHVGQAVTFTVDARPGKTYKGSVAQVRLNAAMIQNVVTYTVVVSTDNKVVDAPAPAKATAPPGRSGSSGDGELELLPYLTADLTFHLAERPDALLVPNAALQWRPLLSQVGPDYRDAYIQYVRKRDATGPVQGSPGDVSLGDLYPRVVKPAEDTGTDDASLPKPRFRGPFPQGPRLDRG